MGQMLRGGRSWPSERNSAVGAPSGGNFAVAGGACGSTNVTAIGALAEQQEAQALHLSPASCA